MKKPRILIIYTGGTIGMIENPETHALQPFNFDHLMDNVPKIKKLDYEINNIQFQPPIAVASCLQIASPRPVPPLRAVLESTWT